jgi:hypothetical protein
MEIFSVGQWNKDTFTVEDLDHMVNAFHTLGHSGKLPLKLGHEGPDGRVVVGERDKKGQLTDPMSQFAMGWVLDIKREGNLLLADVEVPEKVYKLLEDKYLKFVSVELFSEVRASRTVFPWVLDAVALLGADPPAVGILTDIQTLTMSAREVLPHSSFKAFSRADVRPINSGVKKSMSDENITLETLSKQMLQLTQNVAALQQENTALKTQAAANAVVTQNFTTLKAQVAAEKVNTQRTSIKNRFERAIKDGDILPVVRDRFFKAFKIDTCDETLMGLDLENDIEAHIKQNPNPNKKKENVKRGFSVTSPSDDVPEDMEGDIAMNALVQAQLKIMGKQSNFTTQDFIAATAAAMQANPEVAKRYQNQQNEIGNPRRYAR